MVSPHKEDYKTRLGEIDAVKKHRPSLVLEIEESLLVLMSEEHLLVGLRP